MQRVPLSYPFDAAGKRPYFRHELDVNEFLVPVVERYVR
jgi:hypothetical protein